ncbi:hypothetical protein RCOM_1445020 [Ricinus communis]|uniref:DEUBAD domain-containing protein n=1 Tax=Ricinus communis TaxID=3988 RepID=B9RGW7_RICCO|nr:hypothetical protein RCOM_1445020 [Ricinus communis]
MPMVADHRRKRLNGVSIAGCSSWEQYKTKKKKLESPKNELNTKSHISLEWDGNKRRVVAKREQIGLRQKDLREFVDPSPQCHSFLADVLAIPQEIFEVDNLTEILSYEVWKTHLSESERKYLMQFLPRGSDGDKVVQALLTGDNFHFGNPYLKWQVLKYDDSITLEGASVCSGKLHPDAVVHQEQCIKADKKAYYSEIQNYHNDMIRYLQKLKETWESSKDPEKEVLQKLWRSRRDVDKQNFSHANESRFHDPEETSAATSESCSLVAEEKACSSDNQNSSITKGGEVQRRIYEKRFIEEKRRKPSVSSDDARFKRGEKLQKHNIHHTDGVKYMSYLKISKKQHELVKSMKQSGKSIQSKCLNRVLGNFDTLQVQPYEKFVKEEQKKLREHWLQLANKDLPAAYENWQNRQFQRCEIAKSLECDMKDRLESLLEDEEKESHGTTSLEDQNDEIRNQDSYVEDNEGSGSGTSQYQSPQHISSFSGNNDLNPVHTVPENDHMACKSDDTSPNASEYSGNANAADASINPGIPISAGRDLWPAVSMPHTFYDSSINHEYGSTGELSLPHPINEAQRPQLIDLESDVHEQDTRKNLLQRQPDVGSFSSYPNQDRSGLLQSLFKGQDMLPYHSEQKQTGLDFQLPQNMLIEDGNFNGHLQRQLQPSLPLEQGQRRHGENYMQQPMSEDMYSEGGAYSIPRQGHEPPVNLQDWPVNPVRMSAGLQPQLNNDALLNQNWYSGEHQVRGGWNSTDGASVPGQRMGSNTDQSLYSVLSQYNQLRMSNHSNSMGPTEQFMLPRNYGMESGVSSRINTSLPQAALSMDYINGRDTTSSLMSDDMGWVTLPQNPALHDPVGKSYLRSWNQ